jgi:hypothetical protein
MDTIFKVCDAMENATLSAATVAPRCFVCGTNDFEENISREETAYVLSCGDIKDKCGGVKDNFASYHVDYFVDDDDDDDNSICVHVGDNESDNESDANLQSRSSKDHYKNTTKGPLHSGGRKLVDHKILHRNDETFGKESSWASIDGRPPKYMGSKYSKSQHELPLATGLHDRPTDDDTYGTYSETNCDDGEDNCDFEWDKIGLGLFGVPLQWTHVVKMKSSWGSSSNSNSNKTSSTTSSTSHSSSEFSNTRRNTPKNRRDDHNSLEQKDSISMHDSLGDHYENMKKKNIDTISSKEWEVVGFNPSANGNLMTRELPSFGKSREFRSFGSRSLEKESSLYSLKPTYMTANESKQLHEESSRYKYIIYTPSSDRSSTASTDQRREIDLEYTTTIPYSSLSKRPPTPPMNDGLSSSPRSKRKSFERFFRN